MTPDYAKQLIGEAREVVKEMLKATAANDGATLARLVRQLCEIITREQVPDAPDPDSGQSQPPQEAQEDSSG